MTRVMFRCPVSGAWVPTGVVIDEEVIPKARIPTSGSIEHCADCGRRHDWWRTETLLEGRPPRKPRREIA